MTVFRRLRGNALAISRRLDAMLPDLRKSAPPGIRIMPVYDQGTLVRTSIANVRDAILIGGAFSVLDPVGVPPQHPGHAADGRFHPLSLIITFVFLHLTGDTLNLMSLGGLAVAIGLIIDDSVVVVENIARHLAEGQSGDEAIDRASREISGAVIGSTLTTILVFLPLAFVHGVVGQFFQSLSLALTVALLVSMVVSLTRDSRAGRALPAAGGAMPTAGRSTASWPTSTSGLSASGCAGRGWSSSWRFWPSCPAWWFYAASNRFHAGNGRRGLRPRLLHAGRDFAGRRPTTCCAADRACSWRRPTWPAISAAPGRRAAIYATEASAATSGRPETARPARGRWRAIFTSLRKELQGRRSPSGRHRVQPLIQDQINDLNGVDQPGRGQDFGPERRSSAGWPRRSARSSKQAGAEDVEHPRPPGQPGPDRPARQRRAWPASA